MNILEQIYEINFEKINFLERKHSLKNENTIIIGPPKCGKSYLIYDFLSKFDSSKYIYIDFDDYRNIQIDIIKNLEEFISLHSIEILVLENFKFDFDLPKVTTTIITSKIDKDFEEFHKIYLNGLDFEEFILFDNKHQNTINSFNSFLKFGNLPEIIEFSEIKKSKRNNEICKLYCENSTQLDILYLLIKSAGENKSIFQLYNQLKKTTKISKDKFYEICEKFDYNNVVYFCEKYNQPKAAKKIFVFDHSMIDFISYNKNFTNLFKNMLYLELLSKNHKVYYLDNIDFFLPLEKIIILAIPFYNDMILDNITKKLIPIIDKYDINEISIITVSGEKVLYIDEIEVQIMQFPSWALTL
ncbi:MAG: ATP-binding protein [Campylobacterota bacterium]|nr:ATP-binding protein [Campylobacterota bacterium]